MMYSIIKIGENEYKARLTAKSCVELEKKLGTNPINILMDIANANKMPSVDTILVILHASLQAYNHNISLDETYFLYDRFIDDGHSMVDLIPIIIDIFKVSGLLPEEKEEDEVKNA